MLRQLSFTSPLRKNIEIDIKKRVVLSIYLVPRSRPVVSVH